MAACAKLRRSTGVTASASLGVQHFRGGRLLGPPPLKIVKQGAQRRRAERFVN